MIRARPAGRVRRAECGRARIRQWRHRYRHRAPRLRQGNVRSHRRGSEIEFLRSAGLDQPPPRSTASWSAKDIASPWSCVTRIVVMPAAASMRGTAPAHLLAQAGVERRERLVQQHQPRLARQRAGQRDALLLAAGELVRLAPGHRPVELDQSQQLQDARRSRSRAIAIQPKRMLSATLRCGNSAPSCDDEADVAAVRRDGMRAVGEASSRRGGSRRRRAPRTRRSGAAASSCPSPTARRWPCGCRPRPRGSTPASATTAP